MLEAKKAETPPKKSDQPPTESKPPSHVQVGDALIDHLLPL